MKITADTNVLVRAITGDDERQSRVAQAQLAKAEMVALPLPVLCELTWVLSQGYKISSVEIAETVRRLLGGANVAVNRPAAEAGWQAGIAAFPEASGAVDIGAASP
jgi:predicted nucleic-acid-binding protein